MTVIAQFGIKDRIVNVIQNREAYFGGRYSVEVIFKGDEQPIFEKKGFCYDAAFDYAKELVREINRNQYEIESLIK